MEVRVGVGAQMGVCVRAQMEVGVGVGAQMGV